MTDASPCTTRRYRLGTRGSALALAQAAVVTDRLGTLCPDLHWDIEIVRTEGDVDKISPLTEIGGRGVFTNALQDALLRGEIDGAVHSAKDLPTNLHADTPVVAFPDRDDPRDVLVSRHGLPLDRLPPAPVIGTSSRRREVQIRRLRPDARIVSLRGNIDTRLRKAEGDDLDAIVLAAAGLRRMGWESRVTEYFAVERLVPAPAQGALAIQGCAGSEAAAVLAAIDDPAVSGPVHTERAFLAALGAGCAVPVGAYAERRDGETRLLTMLASLDGERIISLEERLSPGREEAHAAEIAAGLLRDIGVEREPRSWNGWHDRRDDLRGARVVVTRPREQAGPLIRELSGRGAEVIAVPTIRIVPVADPSALDAALAAAAEGEFAWLVFTSVNAVGAVADRLRALGLGPERLRGASVATVGRATAEAAVEIGLDVAVVPNDATADGLALALGARIRAGDRVLYPRSAIGRETIPEVLRRHGAEVIDVAAYQTVAETDIDEGALAQIRQRAFDVVTFASPSSVRQFVQMLGEERNLVAGTPAVCVGPASARATVDAGFTLAGVATDPGPQGLSDAVAAFWHRGRDRLRPRSGTSTSMMAIAKRSAV